MISKSDICRAMGDCYEGGHNHDCPEYYGNNEHEDDLFWQHQLETLAPVLQVVWQEGRNASGFDVNPYLTVISEPENAFSTVEDADGAEFYKSPAGQWRYSTTDIAIAWETIHAVRVTSHGS